MDSQQKAAIEERLGAQWRRVSTGILDHFTTISRSDLDAAVGVDDLVRRIADKSRYSERYVEETVGELVGVGGAGQQGLEGRIPFGQSERFPPQR